MKIFLRIVWFVMLTVVTQVGGLVYVIHLVLYHKVWKPKKWKWLKRQASFVLLYAFVWLIVIPPLAKLNNRRPLPYINITTLQPQNWFTVFCNRHYVHEDLYYTMEAVSEDFSNQSADRMGGLTLNYLDANFPFMDGFPLIPHLSHNDGKKLDLAFRYNSNDESSSKNQTRSLLGYGVYEEPQEGEIDQTAICKRTRWQYDITKYIGIPIHSTLRYDGAETERLMSLLIDSDIEKIFIEPHLKQRMGLFSDKIRFHGCHAVRHDDHIHVQIP